MMTSFITHAPLLPLPSTSRRFRCLICSQAPSPPSPPSSPPLPPNIKTLLNQLDSALTSTTTDTFNDSNKDIQSLISELETSFTPFLPTIDLNTSPLILGQWRSVLTNRPSSASLLQRTLLSLSPTVDQLILGSSSPEHVVTRVSLPGGTVLNVKASVMNIKENRISLRFNEGWFSFFNGSFRLPYPVPFKLLGKKTYGWQDITVLSDKYRIVRGNRGSCFLLRRLLTDDSADKDLLPITQDVVDACSSNE